MSLPEPAQSSLEVLAAGETDRGIERGTNEDAVLIRADIGLYVVADGAGGHNAGNVASAIATSTLAKYFDATDEEAKARPEVDSFGLWSASRRLSAGVQRSNHAVIEIARSSNKYRGMGTTIVCAVLVPETGRLHVAHVGDSRCYRLRQGEIELLTPDHSILNDVVELFPELDDVAVSKLPRKAVTRALGMEERVRVAVRTFRVLSGDRYLLCSDGVTAELGDSVMANLLGQNAAPADIVRDLVRAANEKGGRDNITALVIDCRARAPGVKPERRRRKSSAPKMAAVRVDSPEPEVEITGITEVSVPEIVLFTNTARKEGSEPSISIVPANSADANTIRALDRVAGALGPHETTCKRCGARHDRGANVCPRCGDSDGEPLSRR